MSDAEETRPSSARLMQLRVRLKAHVRIHRHDYRGRPWYVIEDPASGRVHRVGAQAHEVLRLLDGARSLAQVLDEVRFRLGEEAPSAEELAALVGVLYRADLAVADARADVAELATRAARLHGQRLRQYFLNPLALRFPLLDPDRFLQWAVRATAWLPTAAWVAVWAAVVAAGGAVALSNAETLRSGFVDRILSTENLMLLWFCYPVVKLLHELGHGIAIRRLGGQVHEMGVMLLVLVPVPYVEASATAAFPGKGARMLVGAAGVLTELFLAGAAMLVWAMVEPGMVRAVCFNVALIAGVSTLIFNGNPLMRFDGYYVFADWVEIPNLGQRAYAYLGYLVQRYGFGVRDAVSPASAADEAPWLLGYGIASFCYRLFISVSIVLLVAGKYFFVGVLLAIWGIAIMIVRPVARGVWFVAAAPRVAGHRARAVAASLAAVLLLAVALLVPVPQWTRAEGVVWVPEDAQLRAGSACWIRAVLATPGARVRRGDALIDCDDPELAANVRVLEGQLHEMEARDTAYLVNSRLYLDIAREAIVETRERLDDARRRHAALTLRSPVDGRFVMPGATDAAGRYARRGELLAYVLEDGPPRVRAVIEQDDLDLVRNATRAVRVRFADRIEETLDARVRREVPGASDRLPSAALAVSGGGRFGVDPSGVMEADAFERPKVLTPVFQLDLEVADAAPPARLGTRVYIRFAHPAAPVAQQFFRVARQLLLRRFDV